VENRLHWVLDVIFREDLARFRTGDGPQKHGDHPPHNAQSTLTGSVSDRAIEVGRVKRHYR
jgi:predicted transposase YbfD/YdcC